MVSDELRRQADQFIELRDLLISAERSESNGEYLSSRHREDDYEFEEEAET